MSGVGSRPGFGDPNGFVDISSSNQRVGYFPQYNIHHDYAAPPEMNSVPGFNAHLEFPGHPDFNASDFNNHPEFNHYNQFQGPFGPGNSFPFFPNFFDAMQHPTVQHSKGPLRAQVNPHINSNSSNRVVQNTTGPLQPVGCQNAPIFNYNESNSGPLNKVSNSYDQQPEHFYPAPISTFSNNFPPGVDGSGRKENVMGRNLRVDHLRGEPVDFMPPQHPNIGDYIGPYKSPHGIPWNRGISKTNPIPFRSDTYHSKKFYPQVGSSRRQTSYDNFNPNNIAIPAFSSKIEKNAKTVDAGHTVTQQHGRMLTDLENDLCVAVAPFVDRTQIPRSTADGINQRLCINAIVQSCPQSLLYFID